MKNILEQEINAGDVCVCTPDKTPFLGVVTKYPDKITKLRSYHSDERARTTARVGVRDILHEYHYMRDANGSYVRDNTAHPVVRIGKRVFCGMDAVIKLDDDIIQQLFPADIYAAAKRVQAEVMDALHKPKRSRKGS